MATTYPSTIQTFTNPSGTSTLDNPDHATQHANENDTIVAIQNTLGTTAGTALFTAFSASDKPAKKNNETFGTPTITGGTINNAALTTPKITTSINDTNGNPIIVPTATASAVNGVGITNGATGTGPTIQPAGASSDTNADLNLASKGTGLVKINGVAYSSGSGTDGWTTDPNALVYVSANSFKVTGVNVTAQYTKGTRIKFTNNAATFYGVVASSSFSTDTTVTLFANSDYSIANSAITAPFYSYASNPQGYPTTFNYACSWTNTSTNPAIGNGTFTAKFWVQGNVCTTNIHIIGGSTTTWGTGIEYSWSLPVNPITGTLGDFTGSAILTQNSSGLEVANCLVNSASTMGIVAGAGSFQSLRVNTTNPVTWTTNDKFNMTLSYIF